MVVLVAIHVSKLGLYLPPDESVRLPQTIISVPVHTAVCMAGAGALMVLVAVQLSVFGLYLPPVASAVPPQTIISVSVHTAL